MPCQLKSKFGLKQSGSCGRCAKNIHAEISVGLIGLQAIQQLVDICHCFVHHPLFAPCRSYVSDTQLDSIIAVPVVQFRRKGDVDGRL